MASAKAQIHFSGESPCGKFVANAFRPSFCSKCSKLISKHRAEVVDDSVVERALEHLVESLPSTVLCQESGQGALFLGGYKAAINLQFLTEQHVDVVTAAGGLEKLFGPKYEVCCAYSAVDASQCNTCIVVDLHTHGCAGTRRIIHEHAGWTPSSRGDRVRMCTVDFMCWFANLPN